MEIVEAVKLDDHGLSRKLGLTEQYLFLPGVSTAVECLIFMRSAIPTEHMWHLLSLNLRDGRRRHVDMDQAQRLAIPSNINMMESDSEDDRATDQQRLVSALSNPACYPHPVGRVRVLETHISWVLLTGSIAYKIKKAVDLGFLDFSTLALRKHFCEEELRLNRRLAPAIYIDVVAIRGTPQSPRIGEDGPVIEYAVRMREFPQELLAHALLQYGTFGPQQIDALAVVMASFHAAAAPAGADTGFGAPEVVLREALQNFEQIRQFDIALGDATALETLRSWTLKTHAALRDAMVQRAVDGSVRECHGDLHLGNIAVLDGQPTPFDCIEFSPELRWIDVMSELAFLTMDLTDRGHPELAARFLNRYLEETGDYEGLRLLDFYQVYRALVRAKVHGLRNRQHYGTARADGQAGFSHYLGLSGRLIAPRTRYLLITHGLSGCGKTTLSQALVEHLGAVRIRSDVERKRLHGLAPLAASGSAPGAGIYTPEATADTYLRLAALAGQVIESGYPVIVDAAFLRRIERTQFFHLAEQLRIPYVIASVEVPEDRLRARIIARQAHGADASEAGIAVLEHQLMTREPLAPEEIPTAVALDGTCFDPRRLCEVLENKLRQASMDSNRGRTGPAG